MSLRYVSINQLSDLTGKDRRTITKRVAGLTAKKQGKAHLYDAREALAVLFGVDTSDEMSTKNLQQQALVESVRVDRARAEKMEMELAAMRGQYVAIEEAASTITREYSNVRAQMLTLPSKLAKPLSMVTDPHEVFDRIMGGVVECLDELRADTSYEQRRIDVESSTGETPDVSEASPETASETESSGVGGSVSGTES